VIRTLNKNFAMKLTADIKKILVMAVAVASVSTAFSQYAYDYKRSADKFYANGDYYSAADNYEKLLDQKAGNGSTTEPYTVQKKGAKALKADVNRQEIVYRIAESYRQLNNYTKAEKWYGEAASNKTQYPLAAYWYGVSLKANGKFPEAERSLQDFLASYKTNDEYKEQAQRELASVQFIQQQMGRKDLQLYSVSSLPVNAAGADYAAGWNNNSLVFTSTRADSSLLTGKNKNPYVNNLYTAAGSEGVYTASQKMVLPVNDNMEQGVASFTTDGSKMYFTRWVKKNGKNLASIYVSQQQNGSWSAPELVGGKVNVEGYSSQQPQVTADGKYLLFASNRPGGAGGFDLYYASLNNNGQPGAVNSMGASINTKEDDQAPYYHQPTGTLVFATKGRVGMGGYDLFESKGTISGGFNEPKNLGYPVNSIKDDIYFFNKGTSRLLSDAYISSDRSSECCLQLFAVNKVYMQYVTGLVTDCKTNQPLGGATVKVSGVRSLSLNTAENGSYTFEVPAFGDLQFVASKENYNDATASLGKPLAEMDTLQNNSICLTPIEVVVTPPVEEKKVELKAFFDFARYDLKAETGILLDTLVALMKREPKLGIEIYGYTDKKGTDGYNMNLSRLRAEACKAYLIQNGVAASRLKVFAKGECCEEKPETKEDGSDDPEARQANRRVEFKIILQSL
jgi:outer membrane protein OmpA-like peptidoglycan-associated protein/tetratricopeptide (TPR) repeat protein